MMTTRAVINTTQPVLYQTEPKGNVIALTLTPEKALPTPAEALAKKTAAGEGASAAVQSREFSSRTLPAL